MANPLKSQKHIHFIGIGGIGMSALALLLAARGHTVSGSDITQSKTLEQLVVRGIQVFYTQRKENIFEICEQSKEAPLIVVTSAIPSNNPELETAKNSRLEIWHRSDLLKNLIENQSSIAIAGTHGKTTTSTFITMLLEYLEQDPTSIIGGIIPCYSSNSHAGKGKLLIAEADESDGSLTKFKPQLGIITNIELDHVDHYSNIEELINTMKIYANNCKFVLGNYDCKTIKRNIKASAWWSIQQNKGVDFAGIPIKQDGNKTIAEFYEKGILIGTFILHVPGLHNLSNTVAAIATCRMQGISFTEIKKHISKLKTPSRRFEFKGSWKGRQIIDDYAHHPTEISTTIETAKLMLNKSKHPFNSIPRSLLVIFQPHRYTRTEKLMNELAKALTKSERIILTPIYSANEIPIPEINSHKLSKIIQSLNPGSFIKVANDLDDLIALINKFSLKDDLILSMGAGDISSLWERLNSNQNATVLNKNLAA